MYNPSPSPHQPDLPIEVFAQIGHALLSSGAVRNARIFPDSPPESALAVMLYHLLHTEVQQGQIEIHQRERIVIPVRPALECELDIVLRHRDTGACGIVEVQGWEWHRRTREEHDGEIRKERLLRRQYANFEIYSAREVLSDPCGVAGEVVGLLGTAWEGFDRVDLPGTGLDDDRAPVRLPSSQTTEPRPLCLMEHLRRTIAQLPRGPEPSDPGMRAVRRDYPRAYETWDNAEGRLVEEAFRSRYDVAAIARAVERKPSAIWKFLRKGGAPELQ